MGGDGSVRVQFGAEIGDLVKGMQDMSSTVKSELDKVNSSLSQLNDISSTTAQAMSGIQASIVGAFTAIQGSMAAIGSVLAGGALFKDAIDSTIKWDSDIAKLSRTLGVNMEAASGLAMSLKLVGLSSDDYLQLTQRLERQIKTNAGTLEALGISLKKTDGSARDVADIMEQARQKILEYAEGTNQAQIAMTIFGGRVGELGAFLRLNSTITGEAQRTLAQLGLTVGKDNVQAMRQYQLEIAKFDAAWIAIKKNIGEDVMPLLTKMAVWMNTSGPAAVDKFRTDLGTLRSTIDELTKSLQSLFDKMYGVVPQGSTGWWNQADPSKAYQKGYLTKEYMHGMPGEGPLDSDLPASPKKETADQDIQAAKDAASAGKGKGGGGGGADDIVQQYQQMIERIKDSQKDLNADTKELEYEFWNTKLAMTKQGSDQWWQIWEKMASLYRAMCNQQQQETDKMAKDAAAAGKNAAQMQKSDSDTAIKLQKQKLDMQYSLGQISASERLKQETQLDNQEYGLELNAAYKHLALVMQESNATKDAISKAWLEIEKLQNQHSLVMQKNENQAMQAMKQTWDKYSQEVGSVLTGLAFKHQTMLQTMQSLTEKAFSMMTNWALKELGVWVLNEMEKTAATTAGVAARTTAESAGAATSFMVQAGAVLKSILASAAETFAGIFGFLAPEMGPAAAVPAGAGMAVVLGVAKGLVSLDVGAWEIPHNMVAQLHQGETVVPKSFAEGMRNGGGIGGGGLNVHSPQFHFHGDHWEEGIKKNPSVLYKAIRDGVRDNHLDWRK